MAAANERLAELRALVAEKFPQRAIAPAGRFAVGWEALDREGIRKGAVTEICGPASAGALVLDAFLDCAVREGFCLALIDAANCFEPEDWSEAQLSRLLWVMAGGAKPALKAADLLLRDGNLPVLVLDLQVASVKELRTIPASTWHRFQRVIETTSTTFLVLTPQPMIEGVTARVALRSQLSLDSMQEKRERLRETMHVQVFERGMTPWGGLEQSA